LINIPENRCVTIHPLISTVQYSFFSSLVAILYFALSNHKTITQHFLCTTFVFSQATLSGKVVDEKGKPVCRCKCFIEGTYDGASSNETGNFSFTTANQASKLWW
jgi:hypothetical protein